MSNVECPISNAQGNTGPGRGLSIGEGETEGLKLQGHVHALHRHVGRNDERNRRKVEDRFDAGADEAIGHFLRRLGGRHEDGDVGRLLLEIDLEQFDVAHDEAVGAGADLLGILVVNRRDVEAMLAEAAVVQQRPAHLPRSDEHDAMRALESQDLADPARQLRHRIAEPALAERAEERQVFAHLRRGGAAAARQLGGADGGQSLCRGMLEKTEVEREAADRGVRDLSHYCELFHNPPSRRKSRPHWDQRHSTTNRSGASVSGRARGSSPMDARAASTASAVRPVIERRIWRSCLRRRLKHAATKARKAGTSEGATSGRSSGRSRITALCTLGGGVNDPAFTVNTFSTCASTCAPTVRAPYAFDPGADTIRSATSSCTSSTISAGRWRSASSMIGVVM